MLLVTVPFVLAAVSPASAQLSIPGKLMTYRTVEVESGAELHRSHANAEFC